MCGIIALCGRVDREAAQRAMTALAHRGPDGAGVLEDPVDKFTFGHRRLAIIDPAGGDQPLQAPEHDASLIANGMIYNYKALREEVGAAAFRTTTDSESILRACAIRGARAVADLDGMFAFVQAQGDQIMAARDPLGIKPLYYGRATGGGTQDALCFGSEIKALSLIAEDIKEFPAGHVYESDTGFTRYYDVPAPTQMFEDVDEATEAVRATLERAVVKRLRSDVPLGAFLSGGLDSSIIAAVAAKHLDHLKTFAVGVPGSPDLAAARRVAEHIGSEHHEMAIDDREVDAAMPAILSHLESYDRDLVRSAVPCWMVSRLAAAQVKVVLTGEGADELFAGYTYYRDVPHAALNEELRRSLSSMHNINLQRVDRMTMAHGLEARVPFLDTAMIETAMRVPATWKLHDGGDGRLVEKWLLRRAFADLLPDDIVWRDKAQFDEGSGLADMLGTRFKDRAIVTAPSASRAPRCGEEAAYQSLLADQLEMPEAVLGLVAHWSDRPVA